MRRQGSCQHACQQRMGALTDCNVQLTESMPESASSNPTVPLTHFAVRSSHPSVDSSTSFWKVKAHVNTTCPAISRSRQEFFSIMLLPPVGLPH